MNITVNGETRDVSSDTTLLGLIEGLGLKPEITAVQRNDDIIHRDDIPSTGLAEGDRIELIRVVGGG